MEPHIFQEKHIRGAAGGRLTRMETKGGSFHVFFVLLSYKESSKPRNHHAPQIHGDKK